MSRPLLASLIIAVGAAMWGLYWTPLHAIEAAGVSGATAVALFNLPAAIVSGFVCLFWRPADAPPLGAEVLAGFCAGLGLALYAMGLLFTTVVKATLLFYLTPVWSTLAAMAILGERPGALRWLALGIALAGLALILGLGGEDLKGFGIGEMFSLASGVAWAFGAVLIRRNENAGPVLTFAQFAVVILVAGTVAASLGEAAPETEPFIKALSPFVVFMSLAILLSIYAIFWAVAQVSPGRAGLLMMTEVVVAVISASILLPEQALSATEWVGAALIVGAGVVEVLGGERDAAVA